MVRVRSSLLSECIERFPFSTESVRVAHWTLVLFLIASVLWKLNHGAMKLLLQEIRRNPLLWLLIFVPIALAAEKLNHEAHTLHFVLSVLSFLLLLAYALGLWFSLNTHRELFAGAAEEHEAAWPIGLALATLAGVTVFVALVSEMFVGSVQYAATAFGMSPAFVGFIVVALVGAAAEMAAAFSAARKNRLDLSVSIALGSAAQIALFVAPVLVLLSYLIGPAPMDLNFWPGAVAMVLFATLTASLVSSSGRSAWFVGVLAIMVYLIFATALYLLPPSGTT